MKTCTSTLGRSQRHRHHALRSETMFLHTDCRPSPVQRPVACWQLQDYRATHCIASLLGDLPHFQDFFGSLKLTDLLGWDVSIHAAMHLPLQILSMSGAKIRIGRFWTATLATFPTIPSSSHASIHPNDLWSERKLTVGDTRAHRAHRAHGFIGILGVFRLRHLISIFGFCILPSEHCKSKCFHAAFMLHDASLTGDQGVKPHSQSRLRDFDVP